MPIVSITESNIDDEHICCAIGNDKPNKARAETKKAWMKEQFGKGLAFKRLDERGKVFIEYMPIETAWKPIIGEKHLVINCLWVSGQFKGQGYSSLLLGECIKDARAHGKHGIAVVTGEKARPFLTDKKIYLKNGFASVDTAEPYFEPLALKIEKDAPDPRFSEKAKTGACDNKRGLTFIYSNQCPFMEEYVELLSATAVERGIPSAAIRLKDFHEAQSLGSPFGTLGIYFKGKFLTHELMTKDKFVRLIEKSLG
jgi:GNAT superfamily N-acetyltransferase